MYTVFLMHGVHETGYLKSDYLTEMPFWVLCNVLKSAWTALWIFRSCFIHVCDKCGDGLMACSCISLWSNRHVCMSVFRNSSFRSASKWMVKLVTWVVAWSPSKGARAKSQWHQRSPSLKGKSEIRDSLSWRWMLMKGW